ncbi:MAG: hypothetical protein JOZ57_15120, partial [Abitibacteriaceae bacterium]|nr:hypothetical protein [Abditibacteriaceae bacterium]
MINQPSPSCYPNQHSQARLSRLWSFGFILASLRLLCRTPLAQAAAPSNDNYASASLISGATGTTNGTTVEATIEPGEDTYPFAHYASVWYVWTAPADGLYKFTATPATGSVNVSAYAGDSLATASLVAYNNNPIQFSATAGTTYHIAVDGGSGGNQTTFSLAWAPVPPPANDNFANAQTVSGSSGSMGGTTVAATREFFEPNPNLQNSINPATVWYKWTAPATGHFSFDATYTSFGKPTVAVYSGSNLYALSLLATNNYSDSARFDATAGKTYYIQVSDNSSSGDFTLTWALLLPPANDNFGSAQNLDNTGPGTVNASNVAATKEPGEPDHAGNTGGRSVWYKWIAPATGPVRFTTNSSGGFTALLAVYSGSAVNNLSLLGSSSGYYNNAVTILALAGVTYYIAIDGYNSTTPSISGGIGAQEGTFSLSWDVPPTPPVNDNFPNASGTNNAASGTINGNNAGATKETGEPNHGGNPGGKSLWYNWTAPATGRYSFTVQAANPLTSFIIGVYTGNSVNALATVASGSDPYNSGSVVVRFNATAGTTYHIAVDGQNSVGGTPANASEGDFSVTWALLPPPANDNFANATVISTTSGSLNGTTVAATKESGEPNHAGNPGGRSVWYKWVASSTGVAKFAVDKADLLLAVYTGSSVNSLTPVASSASGGPVKFNSVAGTTYYIAVDGADNGSGAAEEAFTLTFSPAPPPPNDNFANAAMISNTNSGSIQGTNVNATKEPGEPNHAGNPGGSSVWYAWTAPATGRYSFDATFSSQPPYSKPLVAVYTGNSINALTPVADNRGLNSSTGGARFQATAGDTYFIAVDGQGDGNVADEGTFTLTWSPATPPANDNFANAAVISNTTSGNIQGTNVNATKEPGEPNHAGNAGGASVWYAWTAPANGRYSFYAYDYPNSIYTYPVAVYTGNSVNALTLVADTSSSSSAVFDATAGATYDIAVDGPSGQGGGVVEKPFVLNWNAVTTTPPTPPANDNFVNSQQLNSTASGYLHSTNEGATKETGEPNHAGNPGGASVWYKWTAPANGRYSFDASADLLVAVYTGSSVNALTLLADNRAAPGARFVAAAGTTYYIAVDGYLSPSSPQYGPFETPFNLSWSPAPPPPNDNFANAAPLSDPSGNVQGTNVAATKEAGEPNHAGNAGGASVWYAWTAPTTGRYSFSVSPDVVYLNPMLLAVYTGSGLNTLTLVADNSLSSVVRFQATAGTTYYIAVDGPYSSGGINGAHESQFALTWSPAKPPANDNFINAQQLGSKDTGSITSDNLNATKETGEPNHAGNAGGASVWYSWIAPNSGRYSFSLPHYGNYGGFKLAVYTGSSVNALTLVADSSASAQARFSATAGTVYYIAVDGFTDSTLPQYGANEGTFTLTWSPAPTPANDNFANAAVINGARGNINGTTINATKEIGEPNHAGNAG